MSARGGALVTGAGRRIGRALALAAADMGYAVLVHHRASAADAQDTVDEITRAGGTAATLAADLADRTQAQDLVPRAVQALGAPLTLLVNNASLFEDDRLETLGPDSWNAHMAVNLHAPIALAQAMAAQAPAGSDAVVVNLLDQRVLHPDPTFFSYTLSKGALHYATRMMAQALAPRVRVVGIGPGPTLASRHQTTETFAAEARSTPLGAAVPLEEITAAFRYLVNARAVTGQTLVVDQGQHLAWTEEGAS